MNKYTELSDFEINKRVAEKLGITHECDMGTVIIYRDSEHHAFDPCNNPADAMPIAFENRINLRTVDGYMDWYADHPTNSRIYSHNINPLRAAMEVFLMMKDAENEKV